MIGFVNFITAFRRRKNRVSPTTFVPKTNWPFDKLVERVYNLEHPKAPPISLHAERMPTDSSLHFQPATHLLCSVDEEHGKLARKLI